MSEKQLEERAESAEYESPQVEDLRTPEGVALTAAGTDGSITITKTIKG